MADSQPENVITLHPGAASRDAFVGDESPPSLNEAGGPPHDSDMDNRVVERVAKLEGAVRVAGGAISLLLAAILALVGVSATFMTFHIEDTKEQVQFAEQRTNARMDSIETKIDALPGQLTDIANAISNAITASRPQGTAPTPPQSE